MGTPDPKEDQCNTATRAQGAKCKISKKTAVICSRKRLVELHGRQLEKVGLKAKKPRTTS
eukprot:6080939-Karenia_brevis.AAC.1